MSFVPMRVFEQHEGNTIYELKTYAIDNRFYVRMVRTNPYEGMRVIEMDLSVYTANELKTQLEEFITQRR